MELSLGLLVERLPGTLTPVADPPDLAGFNSATELRRNINRVLERFHDDGLWQGLVCRYVIATREDANENRFITLPRFLETMIRGGKAGYFAQRNQSMWHEFIPGGSGIAQPEWEYYGSNLDMGTGYATFADITTPSQVTFDSNATETSATYVWVRGLDASGDAIQSVISGAVVNGERLDLSGGTAVTTAGTFASITSIEKETTLGVVDVKIGSTSIGRLEPGERVANYRRYRVSKDIENFVGIFKRKHVWADSDNDILYPSNQSAIEFGLRGLIAEDKQDMERATFFWQMAYDRLNKELATYNMGQEGTLQMETGGPIPWVN